VKTCKVCGDRLSLKAGENCTTCRAWAARLYERIRRIQDLTRSFEQVVSSLGGDYLR
jgi:hypothetical protein